MRAERYASRYTGEEVTQRHRFEFAPGVYPLVTSAAITIVDSAGVRVVDGAQASVISPGRIQYTWTPQVADDYKYQWQIVADGMRHLSQQIELRIESSLFGPVVIQLDFGAYDFSNGGNSGYASLL